MKKRIILGIFFAAFMCGIIVWLLLEQPEVFLPTKSPTGIYEVELAGDKTRPSFPFMGHSVSFNLYKNGQQIVRNAYVYSGDLFDSDFNELYPEHKWVSESVLRFGFNISKSEKSFDSLVISNKTNNVIKYLKIRGEDLYLVFGMQPNSKIELPMPRHSYVAAIGEFENGQPIEYKGVNFFGGEPSNPAIQSCLSVVDNSIRIESTTSAGFTGNNNSNSANPDVPQVENCF
jgi:hypothetical protein